MTIRHLKIFAAVCECGGVTRAAERLHIAQPAVSAAISEMEGYYGVTLFERINKRLVITETGRELLVKAKEVLLSFSDFEERAYNGRDDRRVRLGATLAIGSILIPPLLTRLKQLSPAVSPYVMIGKIAEIEAALLSGDLDFAMAEGQVSSPDLCRVPFSGDSLAALCAPDFPVGEALTPAELSACPLLVRGPCSASRNLLDKIFQPLRQPLSPLVESSDNEALLSAARAGLGVAVLPEALARADLQTGRLRRVAVTGVSFDREYELIRHKNKRFSAAQKTVYELCFDL